MQSENSKGCPPSQCGGCQDTSCPSAGGNTQQPPAPPEDARLKVRLGRIKRKIIVMSGKGGVGKSTVAVNLATAAMLSGQKVGLLDVDLHGPSVPLMLGLLGERPENGEHGMQPVSMGGLKVMSVGFLLKSPDDPVIWRGPMKMGVIRQFLEDVEWGDLDLLVIDVPPGTGDEPLSICQLIPELYGAVIATTPQKVASADVRKSISFCQELGVRVLGVVENMSGFVCPHCNQTTHILREHGGENMADSMQVPFLGSIPMDPRIAESGDEGRPLVEQNAESASARAFREITRRIIMEQ